MPNSQAQRAPLLGALLLLCGASGCNSVPVISHNLDSLLDTNGNLRHLAAVRSPWRYHLSAMAESTWLADSSFFTSERKVEVGDPSYESLKYLLELQDPPGGSARRHYQQMEQVRQFSRFAALCPGRLTRERALLALVAHGRRLGVEVPEAPQADAANGPELRSALLGLVQAAEPMRRAEGREDVTLQSDLAAAADLFGELSLDMEGGWRALGAVAVLARGLDLERPELEPLQRLSLRLQARMVAMALHSGIQDKDAYVRAAAARASYELFGEPFLSALLTSISSRPKPGERFEYSLQGETASQPEVLIATFELVRHHGLPKDDKLTTMEQRAKRLEHLGLLVQVVHESQGLDDQTRTGAMLALASLLPDVNAGLRKEDWLDWWDGWAQIEVQALREAHESSESDS